MIIIHDMYVGLVEFVGWGRSAELGHVNAGRKYEVDLLWIRCGTVYVSMTLYWDENLTDVTLKFSIISQDNQ